MGTPNNIQKTTHPDCTPRKERKEKEKEKKGKERKRKG